jgi:hypothetical protein
LSRDVRHHAPESNPLPWYNNPLDFSHSLERGNP